MIRRALMFAVALGLVSACADNLQAQARPRTTSVRIDGTVAQVVPQGILVNGKDGKKYGLAFTPTSKVTMGGNALPEVIKPGMFMQFTAQFDAEGKPMGEATKMQITERSAVAQESIASEKGPDGKPGEPGPYFVRGTVKSFRDGNLTVTAAGKTVVVAVSSTAVIPVTVSDWTLASEGDTITGDVQALPANPQFTPAMAERVEIKAVQPITGKKKKP